MNMLTIPELKDALVGEVAERGDWVVANLETDVSWPVVYQKHEFDGMIFYIMPLAKGHYPAIALRRYGETLAEARSALLRFLSALSWVQSSGAIVASFTAGAIPRPQSREKSFGHIITADLNLCDMPRIANPAQGLALALMREGRGLNHPAYAFLSFYRVLEAAMGNGKQRGQWITDNIDRMLDRRGLEALAELRKAGITEVGEHLYKSGRMAIAHAASQPIINPDDASDYDRIANELPVMRGLAELAIEDLLGIKTRHTAFAEHLYELDKFKMRIGSDRVAAIMDGKLPDKRETIDLPVVDVELRRREPYPPFRGMNPVHVSQERQGLQLVYQSRDGLVEIEFLLDFKEERLRFDWQNGIRGRDDGSANAAKNGAAICRFILEYVGNGELHIFDSETRDLLSRVDAFIPVNYWANDKALTAQISHWNAEAQRRAPGEAAK